MRCSRSACGWEAIAPSESAAREQYVEHLVEEHTRAVDEEIPDGMVQVKAGDAKEWTTVTIEEAHRLHEELHGSGDPE